MTYLGDSFVNNFSSFLSGYKVVETPFAPEDDILIDNEKRIMYIKSSTPIIFKVSDSFDEAVEHLMNILRDNVERRLSIMETKFNSFLDEKVNEANKKLGISQ